ncbi:MAG TPA: right-handed parallel beta-helix repeat-containing protein [Catalimonadaceae bacterium]|nr:right-handed parallel beta-helix repeat-containing protein [Catalimonadaceae bacterium]
MKISLLVKKPLLFLVAMSLMQACKKDEPEPKPELPVLTTTPASAITAETAQSGGEITTAGASSIVQKGICWSTYPAPDTSLQTKTTEGSGTGKFVSQMKGLIGGTTYFVRAYAVNAKGLAYGNEISFTAGNPCDISSRDRGFLEYEFAKDSVLTPGTYKMNRNFTVKAGRKLTLMAGVIIEAQSNYEFKVDGIIKSLGTTTCPVLFTSKNKSSGDWYGVYINSNDTANHFENTIFEFGGYGNSAINKVCVRFSPNNSGDSSRASFRNCTFRNSAGYGFVSNDEANILETIDNCTFSNNVTAPISVCWEQAEFVRTNCHYSSNGHNVIFLSSPGEQFTKDIRLYRQPIPYQINGENFILQAAPHSLFVGPGVTMVMTTNMHISFDEGSRADFQGTVSEPIVIKGQNNLAGDWGGFLFTENGNNNVFRYVHFSDGGNPTTNGVKFGMINLREGSTPSSVTIENCNFANSSNYALGVYDYPTNTPPPSVAGRNVVNGATRGAITDAFQNGGNSTSGISPGVVNLYN